MNDPLWDFDHPSNRDLPRDYTAFEREPYLLSRVDRDIQPLVAAWNQLSFSRTLYSCSGHYAKKRPSRPYVYFVVDPHAPETPPFIHQLATFAMQSTKRVGMWFELTTSYAVSYDHDRLLGYHLGPVWDMAKDKMTRTKVRNLREHFWPGLLAIVDSYAAIATMRWPTGAPISDTSCGKVLFKEWVKS